MHESLTRDEQLLLKAIPLRRAEGETWDRVEERRNTRRRGSVGTRDESAGRAADSCEGRASLSPAVAWP